MLAPRMTATLTIVVTCAIGLVCLSASAASAGAQDALQVIDNPSGGHVVYGPVNQSSPQGAMAATLRRSALPIPSPRSSGG